MRCARTPDSSRSVGPSSAGSGMLQCTRSGCAGNSGHISRTRSHSVITKSNRCDRNSPRCLVRYALMSMPCFLMTRTALGCSGLGWLPALAASTVPADSRSSSASAICERALFPVHRNKTRGRRRERPVELGVPGDAGVSHSPGWSAPPAPWRSSPATSEIDAVVAVPTIGRATTSGHQLAGSQLTQVVRHQALRLVEQLHQLPDRTIAVHQLPQQPPPNRVRDKLQEPRRTHAPPTGHDRLATRGPYPHRRTSNKPD